jgi:hypothetical protein
MTNYTGVQTILMQRISKHDSEISQSNGYFVLTCGDECGRTWLVTLRSIRASLSGSLPRNAAVLNVKYYFT